MKNKIYKVIGVVLALAIVMSTCLCAVWSVSAAESVSGPVDSVAAGVAYKYGMIQGKVSTTAVYYLNGTMSGYYMGTTTNVSSAVDVYLEEATDGYYLYAMVDGAKKYINMVVSGTYVNGKYEDAASTVYTFDATDKILVSTVNSAEYSMGTRNDKTYTTAGPVKTSYNGFHLQLYTVTTTEEPEEPEVQDPAADSTLTVAEAIALGASKDHNVYTEGKYYVAGEITEVYNATYGNMYIKDAEGNTLTIYGTYSADGSTGYSAMDVKPVAGDTVKIYGIIGQYNGTPQMKNGWIVEHTPAVTPEEPDTPVEPEEPETPAGNSATYVFADYVVDGELGGGAPVRELDSTVTFTISSGWITGDTARIYKNANAVIASTKAITSIVINAGNKTSTFDVYTSENGTDWTLYQEDVPFTSAYADVEVAFETPVKYIKIDCPNAQLRAKTLTVNFASDSTEEPTECEHVYTDDFDAFCDKCDEIREINYPADSVELREIDGVKYIYVNGMTSVEGLFKVGDDYYYATWGGVVLTGDQYVHLSYCDKAAGRHFYFSEDGKMLDKGFVIGEDGVKRLYVDSLTSVEGLFEVEGKYYLATWGGVVLTDGTYYVSESFATGIDAGRNFTVDAEGEILDGIVEIEGQKYLYDMGITVVPGEYEIDGTTYNVTWGGLIVE